MLKSPSKKVVLFSFVMLFNNLKVHLGPLLDVDILHRELYLIFGVNYFNKC